MICCVQFLVWRKMMRLKELRAEKGATQKEVAEVIFCSPLVYSRYERGEREPDIDTLCRLANYFEVSLDDLVERERIKQ